MRMLVKAKLRQEFDVQTTSQLCQSADCMPWYGKRLCQSADCHGMAHSCVHWGNGPCAENSFPYTFTVNTLSGFEFEELTCSHKVGGEGRGGGGGGHVHSEQLASVHKRPTGIMHTTWSCCSHKNIMNHMFSPINVSLKLKTTMQTSHTTHFDHHQHVCDTTCQPVSGQAGTDALILGPVIHVNDSQMMRSCDDFCSTARDADTVSMGCVSDSFKMTLRNDESL